MPDVPLPKPSAPTTAPAQNAPSGAATPPTPPTPPPSARVNQPVNQPLPTPKTPPVGNMPVQPPAPAPVAPAPSPRPPVSAPQASGAPVPPPMPPRPTPASPGKSTPSVQENPSSAPPQPASAKKSLLDRIKNNPIKVGIGAVVAVVAVLLTVFLLGPLLTGNESTSVSTTPNTPNQGSSSNTNPAPAKQTTLTYWGLWEPNDVLETVLRDFEAKNPGVSVNYVKQSHKDYRERLQTAIVSQSGPDVFRYHASWVPMLKAELAPMPSSVMSPSTYQQTFYPVAVQQLQANGQIVGIPLMYDGLGLYYNKKHLQAANAQPPETWAELKTLANQLTIRSSGGVERGGLAIGTAGNVEHFADIIGLLMLQNGADPSQPTSKPATEALQFYTNFMTKDQVWDEALPSSTVAFARGEASMMFAPSWRAHEVLALNPDLEFGIVPVPKLGDEQVGWASYWAEGVNSKSSNKDAAWKLLQYLSSKEVMQQMYTAQSQVRAFGEPYSRQDLADQLASDPYVAPFLEDAPYAQDWYLNTYTHDNGINDLIIKYYEDAVNAIVQSSKQPDAAMTTVQQGTSQVLRQYGVTGSPAR